MKYKISILAITILLFGLHSFSQETMATTGGNSIGSGGSSSYTIGQISYKSNSSASGSVSEGVHQAFEISIVLEIEEFINRIELNTYPNPTSNILQVKINNLDNLNLSYQLYDQQGKILREDKLTNNNTSIKMQHLPTSIYFLKISNNQKLIKIFKILKN